MGKACGQLPKLSAHQNSPCTQRLCPKAEGVLTVLAVPPHEARPARALPADVVAVGSVLALADQGTVLPEKPQGTPLCAVKASPARGALALPIVGTAESSIVAVARVDAVWSPVGRWARLRAVTTNPSRVALAGSINRIASPIIGAGAYSSAVLPKSATGTHFIAEGSCESRQAVTQASDVVAGATAVHALRAGLAAAVSVKPRRADSLASGASVSWCTLTDPIIWRAGCSIFAVTRQGAIWTPLSLSTDTVTVNT